VFRENEGRSCPLVEATSLLLGNKDDIGFTGSLLIASYQYYFQRLRVLYRQWIPS
jgi:hypothetical protein